MKTILERKVFYQQLSDVYSPQEMDFLYRIGLEESLSQSDWDSFASKLSEKMPWQYILGKANFRDFELIVSSDVLIPRPETEELIDWILADYRKSPASVIDFATGSGCIALAIKKVFPKTLVRGCDVSQAALAIAKENSLRLDLNIDWFAYDILNPKQNLADAEVWVCNPPYIRQSEALKMDANVLENEPELALFVADTEPFIFYQKLAELAQVYLPQNGCVYFEINQELAEETCEVLQFYFKEVMLRKDLSDNYRMIRCKTKKTFKN